MKKSIFLLGALLSFNLFAISPTVNKLETNTRSLKADLGKVQGKLDSFKKRLTDLEEKLAIPSHIANDLSDLDESMSTVKKVSTVASYVPPIKSQAEAVNDGIDEIQPPVTKSKDIMQKIADTIEPIRQKVIEARDQIQKLEEKISQFNSQKISPFYQKVLASQSCVDKAVPAKNSCMQGKLDKNADPADKLIATADKGLKMLLTDINKVESMLESVETPLKTIAGFIGLINSLEHGLRILVDPFLDLRKLLHKHFTVKFHYPDFRNPFKKKWLHIKLSGAQIIKGLNHIIKEIKKKLRGALYKVAKLFGLKKLAKKFLRFLDHPLKMILKKLHLNLKIKIKGLGDLEGLGLKLKNPLKGLGIALKGFDVKLNSPQITACGELSRMCK